MTMEQRKNVFVTQLHEREDEEDSVKPFAVVHESAGRLLETGINTLQKTLLLKKEVEVERVQAELGSKREQFRKRMEVCAERQVALQKEQQKMKERVTKFEKFIADNEAKRRRAIQRYQTEVRLKEQKTRELDDLQVQLELLKAKHSRLQKKIDVYKLYEKFLLQSIERLPENYLEMSENQINSLMMRYETLHATNESLVTDLEGNATQLERLKSKYEILKQEHEKAVVSISSEVARLQKQQEKLIDASKQREEWYIIEKEVSREELAEIGQIFMAIGNIAMKCERKTKASLDEKPIANMNIEEKLEAIKEYLVDQNDVREMALNYEKASRSAHGSGRRKGRVHFTD
ncbi:coiled-coil domain-containing protein 42 homolog [Watersipora subatra]|uniref:coiled-coil domain-containing protein 42 homolog n=1 Tax=Watersipora subatra TaxID=2589382 RepID=UPI00355BE469